MLIAEHDVLYYGLSFWSVVVHCPDYVPFQLLWSLTTSEPCVSCMDKEVSYLGSRKVGSMVNWTVIASLGRTRNL